MPNLLRVEIMTPESLSYGTLLLWPGPLQRHTIASLYPPMALEQSPLQCPRCQRQEVEWRDIVEPGSAGVGAARCRPALFVNRYAFGLLV
jgi:hypothetical protein